MVQTIAATRTESSYEARNILKEVYGEHYSEDIPGADDDYLRQPDLKPNGLLPSEILNVYPNPGNGIFTIILTPVEDENLKLFVSDLTGKELLQFPLEMNTSSIILNLQDLPDGTYLIGIGDGAHSYSFCKIVIFN